MCHPKKKSSCCFLSWVMYCTFCFVYIDCLHVLYIFCFRQDILCVLSYNLGK